MKKYDSYIDSGIDWIGDLPSNWQIKRIKHTTYVKGRIGWQGMRSDEFLESSDSYVVTGTDFEKGLVKWDTCYQVPLERYEEDPFIQLREGDLLITKDGTIGKIAVVKNIPKIATLNSGVFLTRPLSDSYVPEFMYWILYSEVFKSFYDYNKSGSTIQHLYQNVFNEFKFPLPTIKEQTAIAYYLDHKTSQIDDLIAKKERLIQLLEEERTAIINQAVTKGLDPTVPMKDSGIEWLGEIPANWEVKKLKFLLNENKDALKTGPFGSHIKNTDYVPNGEFKVYTQRNVLDNEFENGCESITEEKFNELRGFAVFEGDILITTRGSIGRCSIFPNGLPLGILHPCLIRIQINEKLSLKNWVVNYINNTSLFYNNVKYNSNSTIIDVIYGYTLKEIFFPVPTITEQREILDSLEIKINEIEDLISKSRQEIELLKEYKTALISEVVTGKVDVRDEILN